MFKKIGTLTVIVAILIIGLAKGAGVKAQDQVLKVSFLDGNKSLSENDPTDVDLECQADCIYYASYESTITPTPSGTDDQITPTDVPPDPLAFLKREDDWVGALAGTTVHLKGIFALKVKSLPTMHPRPMNNPTQPSEGALLVSLPQGQASLLWMDVSPKAMVINFPAFGDPTLLSFYGVSQSQFLDPNQDVKQQLTNIVQYMTLYYEANAVEYTGQAPLTIQNYSKLTFVICRVPCVIGTYDVQDLNQGNTQVGVIAGIHLHLLSSGPANLAQEVIERGWVGDLCTVESYIKDLMNDPSVNQRFSHTRRELWFDSPKFVGLYPTLEYKKWDDLQSDLTNGAEPLASVLKNLDITTSTQDLLKSVPTCSS